MYVSGYMKFKIGTLGRKIFFILLEVFTWGRWGNNYMAKPRNPPKMLKNIGIQGQKIWHGRVT